MLFINTLEISDRIPVNYLCFCNIYNLAVIQRRSCILSSYTIDATEVYFVTHIYAFSSVITSLIHSMHSLFITYSTLVEMTQHQFVTSRGGERSHLQCYQNFRIVGLR